MNSKNGIRAIALAAIAVSNAGVGLAQKGAPAVTGSGTPGRVAKFTAGSSIGDSGITENKFGQVGIGTDQPTSRLTVLGRVESLAGGFKFPDGSVQTSAGLTAGEVVTSLNGLRGEVQLAGSENIVVTPSGNTVVLSAAGLLRAGDAVTSVNGIRGDVVLRAGPNITLTPSGNTVVIAADAAAASSVVTDATLAGDGSAAAPLRLAVPLSLRGDAPLTTGEDANAVLVVRNLAVQGNGVLATGGTAAPGEAGGGGVGVGAFGGAGSGDNAQGGDGIFASAGAGRDGAAEGSAGFFAGSVFVSGTVFATSVVTIETDNPLDPENKVLRHAAVQSSEVLDVYSGNVVTDAGGEAVVALPDWFEAVNSDLRYQLTVVGTFARAIVAEKVANNRFTIKTDAPNVEVSWQVTGVRSDAAAKARPFAAVAEKPAAERGFYHAPEAFGRPAERGIVWARHGDLLRRAGRDR